MSPNTYNTTIQVADLSGTLTPINVSISLQISPAGGGSLWTAGTGADIHRLNGNVGIGTTQPDEALTVKGKIHTEEIIVDLNVPLPDYVFEQDYELMPLSELARYINSKKHLPGIPTAKNVAANGLRLGEMHARLLEKIEELTLYMIEQNKEMKKLKKQLVQSK